MNNLCAPKGQFRVIVRDEYGGVGVFGDYNDVATARRTAMNCWDAAKTMSVYDNSGNCIFEIGIKQ